VFCTPGWLQVKPRPTGTGLTEWSEKGSAMKHIVFILSGLVIAMMGMGFLWTQAHSAGPDPLEGPGMTGILGPVFQQPIYNWRICADLGVGPVPGTGLTRQRFRLCHNQGWTLLTYCLQPNRPAPALGTICSRTSADTFWCGNGLQNLRTYRIQETPTPTPTATGTPAPTPTPTVTPTTPAPQRRARPGGPVLIEWISQSALSVLQHWLDPVPVIPTPVAEASTTPKSEAGYSGIDFSQRDKWIRIYIYPPNKHLHRGKPVVIAFLPGKRCRFGDNRGCVSTFQSEGNGEVTFLTVHSGIGGEGQAFRQAMEGTGLVGAAYNLKKINANIKAWEGARVVITQGKKRMEGFTLSVVSRVPARQINNYLGASIPQALAFAAHLDEDLTPALASGEPLLIFETCGWRVPGERRADRVPLSSASIYLGVIEKTP
jgi:hypothetical protein